MDISTIEHKINQQQDRKDHYKHIEEQLHHSGDSQISLTDKDARAVILHRNIVNVGYNIQAGCDAKHKLFVNNDTGTVNDTHALSTMALDAKELLEVDTMDVLSDKGYTTGKHIKICQDNGITTYSSLRRILLQKMDCMTCEFFDTILSMTLIPALSAYFSVPLFQK